MKKQPSIRVLAWVMLSVFGLFLPVTAQQSLAQSHLDEFHQQMDVDLAELEQFNREMEALLEEIEALNETMEASGWANNETFERRQLSLSACSPGVFENYPFTGVTETIRGWEGDLCRIDSRSITEYETRVVSCLYTRRDIELMTGPELYLPDDLERTCRSRAK